MSIKLRRNSLHPKFETCPFTWYYVIRSVLPTISCACTSTTLLSSLLSSLLSFTPTFIVHGFVSLFITAFEQVSCPICWRIYSVRRGGQWAMKLNFQTKPFKTASTRRWSLTLRWKSDFAMKHWLSTVKWLPSEGWKLQLTSLYKERKQVRGFCHLYSGQEAVAVGMTGAINAKDAVYHGLPVLTGWTYMRGVSAVGVLSELTGRKSGCARGKGGSMHMYCEGKENSSLPWSDIDLLSSLLPLIRAFYGGNGIVGAQVAFGSRNRFPAMKYRSTDNIWHCTLWWWSCQSRDKHLRHTNMAKFVVSCHASLSVRNNGFGHGHFSWESISLSWLLYSRRLYIPGIWGRWNGRGWLSKKQTRFAKRLVCEQAKDQLSWKMATYRYHGHSMSWSWHEAIGREMRFKKVRQTRESNHFIQSQSIVQSIQRVMTLSFSLSCLG